MYTPHGKKQRDALSKAANLGADLAKLLRPVVDGIPAVVVDRIKSSGSGKADRFSAYSSRWANVRSKKGLQTDKKDFWFTGTMWGTYKVVEEQVDGTKISFTLASDGALGNNGDHLVDIHSDREKQNILEPTDDEMDKVFDKMWNVITERLRVVLV